MRKTSETLFGRFAEDYGAHEIHPGIYAEYVEFCECIDVEATITVGVTVEDTDREFQPPEPITRGRCQLGRVL